MLWLYLYCIEFDARNLTERAILCVTDDSLLFTQSLSVWVRLEMNGSAGTILTIILKTWETIESMSTATLLAFQPTVALFVPHNWLTEILDSEYQ